MSKYTNYEIHPKANELPMMTAKEFEALKENIKLHGLINPIILDHKNRIIDGRNRFKACIETETEPRFITLDDFMKDYVTYLGEYFYDIENQSGNLNKAIEAGDDEKVIEMLITILNVNRRHLSDFETFLTITEKQRFVKSGEFGTKKVSEIVSTPGVDTISEEKPPVTVAEVANKLGVSTTTVEQMKHIAHHGSDELKEEVKQGKKSVKKAYNELREVAKAKQEPEIKPEPPVIKPIETKEAEPARPKNWFEANLKSETDIYLAKEVHNCAARLINEKGKQYIPFVLSWLRRIGKTETFNEIQTWKPEN